MRWLVTGARGQVGRDLVSRLTAAAQDVRAVDHRELDITDAAAVDSVVAAATPDVVVNLAAYTAVDAAETDEAAAYAVNTVGPALLAATLARRGGRLVHLSTDYVFDGVADEPYPPDAPTGPRSAYGRTKLGGEQAVRALLPDAGFVVRTAWVYGAGGANFVKTMARLERDRDTVEVVEDQQGSPTWTADLADGVIELAWAAAGRGLPAGVYHCTNGGATTWFGLARAVFEEVGADPARVLPVSSAAFVRPAPRPAYSVLSCSQWVGAGLTALPDWRPALHRAFQVAGDQLRPG